MENIYQDIGKVITSDNRYVKRSLEKSIQERIYGKNFGSFSLVGLPRIGKSTIVYQVFNKNNHDTLKINIVLSKQKDIKSFFMFFAREIIKQVRKLNLSNKDIEASYEEFVHANFETIGSVIFEEFVEMVVDEASQKLIVIIDEFDHATKLFKDEPHYFQIIREMAIQPNYNTAFVFLSRRLVEEIELQMDGVSNLRQVLKVEFIKPYNREEQNDYFDKLSQYLVIADDLKLFYKNITGYYPYLMDLLTIKIIEKSTHKNLTRKDFEAIYEDNINDFYEQYEKLKKLLIEEELFNELLHIVLNMPYKIRPNKKQRLVNYGILDHDNNIFSNSFKDYVLSQKGMSDYHPIWNKTEKGLKELVKDVFYKKYGKNWDKDIQDKYKNHRLNKFIKDANFYKSQESKNHQPPENTNFVDTIGTSGLLFLIEEEWQLFNMIFKRKQDYWSEVFNQIKNVRNPIQHNREEIVVDNDIQIVIIYCENIVRIIDEYFM